MMSSDVTINQKAGEMLRLVVITDRPQLDINSDHWTILYIYDQLLERLSEKKPANVEVVTLYLEVIQVVGLDFYELKFPLTLLETIFSTCREAMGLDQENRLHRILQVQPSSLPLGI